MQIRQPIYKRAVERWRRYEAHLGPLLEALAKVRSLHRWWGQAIERLFDDQVAVPLNG